MKPDRRPFKGIGATTLVGIVAIAAAIIAGRVIFLKFFPGILPLGLAIAAIGN